MKQHPPLPCPFCGLDDSFVERMQESTWQRVCNNCFAHGPDATHGDWDEDEGHANATLKWNMRAPRS